MAGTSTIGETAICFEIKRSRDCCHSSGMGWWWYDSKKNYNSVFHIIDYSRDCISLSGDAPSGSAQKKIIPREDGERERRREGKSIYVVASFIDKAANLGGTVDGDRELLAFYCFGGKLPLIDSKKGRQWMELAAEILQAWFSLTIRIQYFGFATSFNNIKLYIEMVTYRPIITSIPWACDSDWLAHKCRTFKCITRTTKNSMHRFEYHLWCFLLCVVPQATI